MTIVTPNAAAVVIDVNTRTEGTVSNPLPLWRSLVNTWTRNLERQIEADLRWHDHPGVLEDHRTASPG